MRSVDRNTAIAYYRTKCEQGPSRPVSPRYVSAFVGKPPLGSFFKKKCGYLIVFRRRRFFALHPRVPATPCSVEDTDVRETLFGLRRRLSKEGDTPSLNPMRRKRALFSALREPNARTHSLSIESRVPTGSASRAATNYDDYADRNHVGRVRTLTTNRLRPCRRYRGDTWKYTRHAKHK